MSGDKRDGQIATAYQDASCSTGEVRYVTVAGHEWRTMQPFERRDETGVIYGRRVGDRIEQETP